MINYTLGELLVMQNCSFVRFIILFSYCTVVHLSVSVSLNCFIMQKYLGGVLHVCQRRCTFFSVLVKAMHCARINKMSDFLILFFPRTLFMLCLTI